MPAHTNATITQNMSDRQPDIDSMILSMIFITKTKGIRLIQAYPLNLKSFKFLDHKCCVGCSCIYVNPQLILECL